MWSWALVLMTQVPLPGTSSVTVPLGAPEACGRCHGSFDTDSAFDTWAGSPMGHAARDPWFWSALVEAEKDAPGVGDFCLRCHVPEAWLAGRCLLTDGSRITDDDDGVGCSLCHRMDPTPYVRNGQYIVGDDVDLRGPYKQTVAPHRTQQSDYLANAEACGVCHDLYNPLVQRKDLNGQDTPFLFPEQTTYTEWQASAFQAEGVTCQNCHMEDTLGMIANMGPERPERSHHAPVGGNVFLLEAVSTLYPELGLFDQLNRGVARVEATLRTAAELEVDAPAMVGRGEVFDVTIRVTNLTGHKLPTGYPVGRRIWVSATGLANQINRGGFDPASGEPVEPLEVYRVEQGQASQGVRGPHLALNDTVFFDNRIPPRGFVPTTTTAPVGKVYPEVSPGVLAHFDEITVTATVPCEQPDAPLSLSVGLWYQSITKPVVEELLALNGNHPRADDLEFAFEAADPGPLQMESIDVDIAVDDASRCGAPDAGGADARVDSGSPPDAGSTDAVVVDAGFTDEEGGCACESSGSVAAEGAVLWSWLACTILWFWRRRMARAGPGC